LILATWQIWQAWFSPKRMLPARLESFTLLLNNTRMPSLRLKRCLRYKDSTQKHISFNVLNIFVFLSSSGLWVTLYFGSWAHSISLFKSNFQCPKPVIMAVHSACVGGGTNLICFGDIRYCTKDAWFQVKETALGSSQFDFIPINTVGFLSVYEHFDPNVCYIPKF